MKFYFLSCTLVGSLLITVGVSANSATLEGTFNLVKGEHSDNFRDCPPTLVLNFEGQGAQRYLTVTTPGGYYYDRIGSDLRIRGYNDDGGFIGYNRDGGTVSDTSAKNYLTTAGPVIALFFLPVVARAGQTYELGTFNTNKLIVKHSDTIYGVGSRQKCIYSRVSSSGQ